MANPKKNDHLGEEGEIRSTELTDGNRSSPPFSPRPASANTHSAGTIDSPSKLPPVRDHSKLRLAAADMVEFGISLENAASHHEVDPDLLHVFYRNYVQLVGKENVPDPHGSYASKDRANFDRSSHRQFDRNWAEMVFQADQERPQLTGSRRWLINSPLTSWMFNGHMLDKIAVSGAICVIALGILIFKQTRAISDSPLPVPAPVSKWAPSEGIDGLQQEQQTDLLSQIIATLTKFIEAESWQERLPMVRNPDEVAPLMERYYETHPDGPITPIVVDRDLSFIDRSDGRFALVRATLTKPEDQGQSLIFLIEISTGETKFLVDWKILVNYEPIPWEKFRKNRNETPSPFRVKISPGDYYNHPFMNESEFISLRLSFLNRVDEMAFGYARRDSEVAQKLAGLLEGQLDKSSAVVLNLKFPQGAKFDNILEIDSIISDNW